MINIDELKLTIFLTICDGSPCNLRPFAKCKGPYRGVKEGKNLYSGSSKVLKIVEFHLPVPIMKPVKPSLAR